jgi:hypothetical protein
MTSGFAIIASKSNQLHLGSARPQARDICRPGNLRPGPSLTVPFPSAEWQGLSRTLFRACYHFAGDCIRTTNPCFTK